MRKLLVIPGLILASGCTANMDTRETALTQARSVGAPEDCIRASDISHTRIRNDSTIDFVMRGQQVYRNVLPHSCSGLAAAVQLFADDKRTLLGRYNPSHRE